MTNACPVNFPGDAVDVQKSAFGTGIPQPSSSGAIGRGQHGRVRGSSRNIPDDSKPIETGWAAMPGSKNVATPSNSTAITLELTAAVPSVKCGGRAETLRATAKPKELTVNATFSQINNKAHDMHNFLAAVVKKPRARYIHWNCSRGFAPCRAIPHACQV